MAQKTVKKAPAKKPAPVKAATKKAPVKKAAVKKEPVAKMAAAVDPKMAGACCGGNCGCGCNDAKPCACDGAKKHCGCRFFKKLIVFLVIFALGFVCAKLCCCGGHFKHGPRKMPAPEFVNGCLDTAKIKCPEMMAKLQAADIDTDGCISAEEFDAIKKPMHK
jgi:hypothetical protein